MTCIVDTASINLTVAAGQLSADLTVDPGAGLAPNPLIVNAAGVYVIGSDGWIPLPATLAFSSADAPAHTYVATTSADLRSFIGAGDKIRLVQSGVPAYFFVTAIAAGTITLYGGTNYVLAASAVTLPYFSKARSPIGFNLDPTIWTEQVTDAVNRTQASPVAGTWYNPGSITLAIPIGLWRILWSAWPKLDAASTTVLDVEGTLSTANNSESDPDFTTEMQWNTTAGSSFGGTQTREKSLPLAVKTSYFLNAKTAAGAQTGVGFRGDLSKSIVRAICLYL